MTIEESSSMTGMARRLLESVLLGMAIRYGGYDKIPVAKINEVVRVVFAVAIVAEAVRYVGQWLEKTPTTK